jgi:hypothetical protein
VLPYTNADLRCLYRLAGRAAAIARDNRHGEFPAVPFRLQVKAKSMSTVSGSRVHSDKTGLEGWLEGGVLVDPFPFSHAQRLSELTLPEQAAFRKALAADALHHLAGAVSESKYAADEAGQPFNVNRVYLATLEGFGQTSELGRCIEYLATDVVARQQLVAKLLLAANRFVSEPASWQAIVALVGLAVGELHTMAEVIIDNDTVEGLLGARRRPEFEPSANGQAVEGMSPYPPATLHRHPTTY